MRAEHDDGAGGHDERRVPRASFHVTQPSAWIMRASASRSEGVNCSISESAVPARGARPAARLRKKRAREAQEQIPGRVIRSPCDSADGTDHARHSPPASAPGPASPAKHHGNTATAASPAANPATGRQAVDHQAADSASGDATVACRTRSLK